MRHFFELLWDKGSMEGSPLPPKPVVGDQRAEVVGEVASRVQSQ